MPSYISSNGESDFTPIQPGTYVGRCYIVCNLGLQAAGPWPAKNKHFISFEIPTERVTWTDKEGVEQEGPAVIGGRYTSSLSPKANLRMLLETWRGQVFSAEQLAEFDLFSLIGVPAMISVVHSEDGKYANISGLMKLPPTLQCAPAELAPIAYDPMDAGAQAAFAALSDKMKATIMKGQVSAGQPPAGPPAIPTGHQAPIHAPAPGHQSPSALVHSGHHMPAPGAPTAPHAPHAPGPARQAHQPLVADDDFDDDIPF